MKGYLYKCHMKCLEIILYDVNRKYQLFQIKSKRHQNGKHESIKKLFLLVLLQGLFLNNHSCQHYLLRIPSLYRVAR